MLPSVIITPIKPIKQEVAGAVARGGGRLVQERCQPEAGAQHLGRRLRAAGAARRVRAGRQPPPDPRAIRMPRLSPLTVADRPLSE